MDNNRKINLLREITQRYIQKKQYEKALPFYKRAIILSKFDFSITKEYAYILQKLQLHKKAIKIYKKLIKYKKDDPEVYFNIAFGYKELKKYKKAKKYFKIAKNISPTNPDILLAIKRGLFLESIFYLTQKKYKKGFKLYENRVYFEPELQVNLNKSKYNGKKIEGKKLLVFVEQGFGDIFQFIRFLPLLKKQSKAYIILRVRNEIYELFKNCITGFDEIVRLDEKIEFDYYISIMSLGNIFNVKKVKIDFPYIKVKQKLLTLDNKKLNIGFVYQGNKDYTNDDRRSIDLKTFKKIFKLDYNFYSLQIDEKSNNELKRLNKKNVFLTTHLINDFYDTAKIINSLDLIISVDTSVAHLSAAMNKKTLLLLPFANDWRWANDVKKTHWYPSITIFKQNKINNWQQVIKKIVKYL